MLTKEISYEMANKTMEQIRGMVICGTWQKQKKVNYLDLNG